MESIGIWLTAIGLADLVAGLSGRVESKRRALAGWGLAITATIILVSGSGYSLGGGAIVVLWTSASAGAWLWSRRPSVWSVGRSSSVLIGCTSVILFLILFNDELPGGSDGFLWDQLQSSPYPAISQAEPPTLLMGLGFLLVLQATANGVIRLLLRVVSDPSANEEDHFQGEKELRGGRIIGPLERLLIWGFGLSGQMAAAALVVTAKGLLRFPELSREEDIHRVTEYLLVGSLASWTLAFGAVILLPS